VAAVFACILLIIPSTAWAHKVNVFAYVEGDTVVTESYFSDGRKCQDSVIEVFDTKGEKLLEGTTDAEGQFSFEPPAAGDLLIRLTAAMGHQAEYTVPASDLPEALSEGVPAPAETPSTPSQAAPAEPVSDAAQETPVDQASAVPADVEQLVERAVARQLAPIRRAIEESRNRQRISDIVGGIGYIIGLMGVVLYFHSRRRRE
jgi:nickel transport protein